MEAEYCGAIKCTIYFPHAITDRVLVFLTNDRRVNAGGVIFGSSKDSYFGQFRRNAHLNCRLRYTL